MYLVGSIHQKMQQTKNETETWWVQVRIESYMYLVGSSPAHNASNPKKHRDLVSPSQNYIIYVLGGFNPSKKCSKQKMKQRLGESKSELTHICTWWVQVQHTMHQARNETETW